MTSRTTILLMALAALGGCEGADDTAPLCVADTTRGAPVAKMAGSWTGAGTFRETWNGKTIGVRVNINLAFDDQGVPGTLPALGMISPWKAYPEGGPSLRGTLESGGAAYAYCALEADGSANLIDVHPLSRCGNESTVEWRYRATYKFADLLHYALYDYSRPEAPEVTVEATDSFMLGKTDGRDTLTVRGHATGATAAGQPVELHFEAQLERGEKAYEHACELGREAGGVPGK